MVWWGCMELRRGQDGGNGYLEGAAWYMGTLLVFHGMKDAYEGVCFVVGSWGCILYGDNTLGLPRFEESLVGVQGCFSMAPSVS